MTVEVSARALLDLETLGENRFSGLSPSLGLPRVFGGQLLAQGIVAAARTVGQGRPAHSLHAYFLAGGEPERPIVYDVQRTRDGGRMSCRTVTARQDGRLIAELMCSFGATDGGVEHQRVRSPGPRPRDLPLLADALAPWGGPGPSWSGFDGLEIRAQPTEPDPAAGRTGDAGAIIQQVWQRVPERMPDEPLLHQAMLAYASDVTQLAASLVPHGIPVGVDRLPGRAWDGVSIDHALWFHRPARADDWLLFEQCSPSAATGRAFTRADVFSLDGTLVASVAQEGIIWDLPPEWPSATETAAAAGS
jgi:acyl-CoA thioesterase-2